MPISVRKNSIAESLFLSDTEKDQNTQNFPDFTSNPEIIRPNYFDPKFNIKLQAATRFEYKSSSYIVLYITNLVNLDHNENSVKYEKCFLRIEVYPDVHKKIKVVTSDEMLISSNIELNKKFKLHTDITEIDERKILVELFVTSRFKKILFIGQTFINIWQQSTFNDLEWYDFQNKPPSIYYFISSLVYRGDLHIALKYATSTTINVTSIDNLDPTNQVMLWIKKAENLFSGQVNKLCNAFVKVQLLPTDKKLHPIQKTKCIKNTCNPSWNVILKFEDINLQSLRQMGLQILIYNRISLFRKLFIGGVRLNLGPTTTKRAIINWMDASSIETIIWRQMLNRPNTWICGEIRLRPDMY